MRATPTIPVQGTSGGPRRAPCPDGPVARPARESAGPLTLQVRLTVGGRAAGAAFPQRQEEHPRVGVLRAPDPGPRRPAHPVLPQPDRPARRRGRLIP
jgi:hypothetical protein